VLVLFIAHPVAPIILSYIQFILIYFNAKREFGQVVVVYPETSDSLFPGLFTQMPEHPGKPVPEHPRFFFIHSLKFLRN
jgi:hypothetical protein